MKLRQFLSAMKHSKSTSVATRLLRFTSHFSPCFTSPGSFLLRTPFFFPHRHSLPPDIPRLLSLILHMATIFNARYRVLYPATRILRQSCGMFELRQHYSNRYFRGSSVSSSASNSPLSHCVCLCSQGEKKSYLTS